MIPRADDPAAKPGQKTLKELDRYRYVEAPALFAPTSSRRSMQLGDVQALVEWKLCVLLRTCLILGLAGAYSLSVDPPFINAPLPLAAAARVV
jgi:hypothetical protein